MADETGANEDAITADDWGAARSSALSGLRPARTIST
jgi:hypothetical protein